MDADLILFLLLIVVILIAVTVFGVLTYSGLFVFPTVRTGEPPISYGCTFAYQFLRGPYTSNDVGAAFTLTTSIAPKTPTIGIYYDDPTQVPEDELRCAIGCLISREVITPTTADTNDVVDAEPENIIIRPLVDEREEELLKKKNFRFYQLPRVDLAVVTDFPYTTPFSIWLAPNKVYPRINDYTASKSLCAYPMIELYADNRIKYMAPLSKQDEFFVPEAKQSEEKNNPTSSGPETISSSTETKSSGEPSVTIVTRTATDKIQNVGGVIVESVEGNADDKSTNVRRRRHPPQPETDETKMTLPHLQPAGNAAGETGSGTARKDSSQSSASSSFEEIGVEDLKFCGA